jgi:hypothetical protein
VLLSGSGVLLWGCASGTLGESHVWMRPCGTAAQLEADRQACLAEAAGLADPSGPGAEYTRDLFRQCMEQRGWRRVPSGTVMACE